MGWALAGHSSEQISQNSILLITQPVACEISFGDEGVGKFNADEWMSPKDRRKIDDFILYGICAAIAVKIQAGYQMRTRPA